MIHEKQGNKLSYVGDTEDGYSHYGLELENRLVFTAKAKATEPGNPIYVRVAGSDPGAPWTKTNLRAFVGEEDNPGLTHITSDSMKYSVLGNLAYILADMLIPKN